MHTFSIGNYRSVEYYILFYVVVSCKYFRQYKILCSYSSLDLSFSYEQWDLIFFLDHKVSELIMNLLSNAQEI